MITLIHPATATGDRAQLDAECAFILALRVRDPARTEAELRSIAEEAAGRERERYIRAADLVRSALGDRMLGERMEQDALWQELRSLRRAQSAEGRP